MCTQVRNQWKESWSENICPMLWKRTEQVPKRGPLPSRGVTRAILARAVFHVQMLFPHWITAMCVSYRCGGGGHMNKHMMENATTGQQRQFLLATLPLKWPLLVPKRPSSTRMAKPTKTSWYSAGMVGTIIFQPSKRNFFQSLSKSLRPKGGRGDLTYKA